MSAAQSLSSIAAPLALLHSGAGIREVGTAMAMMSLIAMFQMVFVGAYADRGHLRLFLIIFPLTTVFGVVPFLAVPNDTILLIVGIVVGGLGGGAGANSGGTGPYQPAEYAWIARNYSSERRNRLISSLSARAVGGVIFASAIAFEVVPLAKMLGFAADEAGEIRLLMFLVGAFALLSVLLGALVGETTCDPSAQSTPPARTESRKKRLAMLIWPKGSRDLQLKLSLTSGLNGIAIGTYGTFLTTWLILRFHASPSRLGLINLAISATAIIGDLTCPLIARRMGLVRSVVATRIIQSLLIIPIALTPSFLAVQGLLILRQVVQRLNQPLRDSYSLSQANNDERARISAMTNVTLQGAQSVSSQTAGQIIGRIGFTAPFIVASVFQLASSVMFYYFFSKRPPPEEFIEGMDAPAGIIEEAEVWSGPSGKLGPAITG